MNPLLCLCTVMLRYDDQSLPDAMVAEFSSREGGAGPSFVMVSSQ